jgi:NAD(P)-dependent dehydrogenase (short-subunit alcohol dehydrogenase family)
MSMKALDLSGRLAVVVGGTSGIGRAIALGFAEAGADVIVSGRREALIDTVAKEIEAKGRRSLRQPADVADRASLETLRDRVVAEFGKVDILVNSAGTTKRRPTLDVTEEEWNGIMETNLTGAATAASSTLPRCRRSSRCSKWPRMPRARRRSRR